MDACRTNRKVIHTLRKYNVRLCGVGRQQVRFLGGDPFTWMDTTLPVYEVVFAVAMMVAYLLLTIFVTTTMSVVLGWRFLRASDYEAGNYQAGDYDASDDESGDYGAGGSHDGGS